MSPLKLWIWKLATWWLPETRCFGFKASLLRWCGATVGENVRIVSGAEIVGNGYLAIGDDVFIGAGTRLVAAAPAGIEIGSHVDIAPRVMILTGSHEVDFSGEHIAGKGSNKSVKIGDGTWLCAGAVILPGVEIPPKTLVAAGAVVARSVAGSGKRVGGVPAREI